MNFTKNPMDQLRSFGISFWSNLFNIPSNIPAWISSSTLLWTFSLFQIYFVFQSRKYDQNGFWSNVFKRILVILIILSNLVNLSCGGMLFGYDFHFGEDFHPLVNDWFFVLQFVSIVSLFLLNCLSHTSLESPPNECPSRNASLLSKLTFFWFTPFLLKGYRSTITLDHLYKLDPEDKVEKIEAQFKRNWKRNVTKQQQSDYKLLLEVFWVLVQTCGWTLAWSTALKVIDSLVAFVRPQLLKSFMNFTESSEPLSNGLFIAALFALNAIFNSLLQTHSSQLNSSTSTRIQNALISAIYRKSLTLSNSMRKQTTSGDIINLVTEDANNFFSLVQILIEIAIAPFQIGLAMYFLWLELGASDLVSVVVILALIPIHSWINSTKKTSELARRAKTSERIKIINEILNGIRVVKFYGWEKPFMRKVEDIRKEELELVRKSSRLGELTSFFWQSFSFFVTLITFGVYIFGNHTLDAKKVFVSISLFHLLEDPMIHLPQNILRLSKISVSVKKLSKFLNSEMDSYVNRTEELNDENVIEIDGGAFAWESNEDGDEKKVLDGIDLKVKKGQLVAIVGQVASGKSSLLSAILGDMERVDGTVNIAKDESIGYVAQQAWLLNATLRENVLFGSEYDKTRYDSVIEMCALEPDLAILPDGDQTLIGEKGINLSGGQKQRVAIARACYFNSSLVLLDDPLSAVDSHVAQHIFRKVLNSQTGYLRNRTRVLVMNNINFLPQVDQIVVLENGKISQIGTYQQLIQQTGKFSSLIQKFSSSDFITSDKSGEDLIDPKSEEPKAKPETKKSDPKKDESKKKATMSSYIKFFRTISFRCLFGAVLAMAAMQTASSASNVWLAIWSSNNSTVIDSQSVLIDSQGSQGQKLAYYAIFGFSRAFFSSLVTTILIGGSIKCSTSLHHSMLNRLLRAPTSFFDMTTSGEIINHFRNDISSVDFNITSYISFFLRVIFHMVFSLVVISIKIPLFIFFILPVLLLHYFIDNFDRATSRQLRSLMSSANSPIYSHLAESFTGAATIRAFGANQQFQNECFRRLDISFQFYFHMMASRGWISVWSAVCRNLVGLGVMTFAAMSRDTFGSQSGFVGLIITNAMGIMYVVSSVIALLGGLDGCALAVERIDEFTQMEVERDWQGEEDNDSPRVPEDWPQKGEIEFVQYSMRYRSGLDLVLDSIDFKIKGGEKIGIVGRTGAGKSSLTLALFRIVEGASGKIVIDGLDIGQIGMHQLRHKLAIIPQDPVLFSGTIRSNLDPFGVYRDELLHSALEQCHLSKFISSHDSGLDYAVSENGSNLSLGQRQLICLARALLRRSQILVLDEATASIDLQTDSFIQQTIRTQFAHCTVLTIAHRLNTILDSDRVLLLDQGKVAEFDTPTRLLADHSSRFYSLAKNAKIV